ncbi:Isoprenylcysteine carboxyl methyltransferase family-domain-containing protein, partial [Scheffersomyces coipomensis]|uniref:Isoprenylcysteine carboxyl methyltransferase family-domain-containing protein n=1 Tax=Scheffersomyces coipomensis TaxID=1788519 RepID=UPI00315D51FF
YLLSLIIYFILEYVNTYLYQSRNQISSRSFLIYGNRGNFEFWCCQLLTILEFIINLKKVKIGLILSWWVILPVKVIGMMMIISGLFIRSLSMKTCGESFSHLINTDSTNTNNQKLITHGIYGYFRHPSYFGFWCLSIGIQLWLINPINLLLSLFILQYFFTIRIQVEEYFLIHNIFGMDYINYKNKVKLWIPFV